MEKSFFALNKFELWFIKTHEADESFHGAKALTTCRRVNCDKNRLVSDKKKAEGSFQCEGTITQTWM